MAVMRLGFHSTASFAAICGVLGVAVCAVCTAAEPTPDVDFTRDVLPILSENCTACHGPDAEERQADLRLDIWATEGDVRGAQDVITPGKLDESEFVARITSDDPDVRMPPADSRKTLTPQQIETLRNWIKSGSEYKQHWSFVAPERPEVPNVKDAAWVRNPIDAFVLDQLQREGLKPSPDANLNTLLRRLSLDLIGLPPTLDELEDFETAGGESAYNLAIERLLKSPHYGERWGRLWLDVARYADSDGFEKDKPRFVWMYRDWIIGALNSDMPYSEFLIEQIAGDLLPERTQDNLVATGFLRNSMINEEGGIDPEQFRMEAMFDRMDAIGKGMLGLTIQCAQCHTHKYDPLTHTDYYRMFAFLNNCNEGQASVYTKQQEDEWKPVKALIRRMEDRLRASNPDWPARMAAWEETVRAPQPKWTVVTPKPLDESGQKYYAQDDGSLLAAGYAPTFPVADFVADVEQPKITAFRLEVLNDPNLPHGGPGRSIFGTFALTEFVVESASPAEPDRKTKLKFASATADVNPPDRMLDNTFDDRSGKRRITGPIEYANDGNELTAWTTEIGPARSNVPRKAVFVLEKPLESKGSVHLKFQLSQQHGGWNSDDNQNNNLGRFRFSITDAEKPVADPVPTDVRAILDEPADQRTPEQVDQVFSYWRTTVPEWHEDNRRIDALWQSHPRGATQLVLLERDKVRPTHRLDRGNFLAPADEVSPGVPSFLHTLKAVNEETSPPNRLDFARWLADRRSPTTARAMVNRIWQAYFGVGLVTTAEDLGTQGDPPSHPELLDWLAVELMDNNWSLKHIHKLIVSSSTYRQSSKVAPELLARDPANQLLARGPRYRVDAEVVRDIALAASGLLTDKVGGPSVYPPAPEFLFQPPSSYGPKTWNVETGPDRYRRGLYTFRFRSIPYPALMNFDAPNGEIACARRVRSNTPLQALTTLNEPLYVECARALAMEIVTNGGASDADRLAFAIKRCLARDPTGDEVKVLREFVEKQRERFNQPKADPMALLVDDDKQKEGFQAMIPQGMTPADMATWTALARVVLNLDETITKE
jgi:mono/diheme cytochrome c family protein